MNLATVFFQKAAEQPQQWLILGARDADSIRYGEFSQRVQSLAARLRELGVKPGDNVGLHYPNGSDYIAYNYALWACGACVTPIPVELAEQEKQRIFQFIHMDSVISATRLLNVIVAYLSFGATIVLPRNSFGVSLLQAANQHHVNLIYAAPNHYQMMLGDNTGQTLPDSLRLTVVTTTALNPALANAFYLRFGQVLNETYGIIELGLPAVNVSHSPTKQGSVGKPLSGYELTLEQQEAGEVGEVLVRGDAMLDAYYSPWQSRADILRENNGWFRTGDLGQFDAEGFLYLVGRNKELISVAGMKFFPQEVERVLETHPAIHTACVFASKSVRAGEIPIQFHWVDKLSYTASGKLVRRAI